VVQSVRSRAVGINTLVYAAAIFDGALDSLIFRRDKEAMPFANSMTRLSQQMDSQVGGKPKTGHNNHPMCYTMSVKMGVGRAASTMKKM
jgi:hypothetical protein